MCNSSQFTSKKRWQPLLESDALGYISTQEHVVPHIGATARLFGFNSPEDEEEFASRELSKLSYRTRSVYFIVYKKILVYYVV